MITAEHPVAPRAPAATTPWRIARRWRIAPIVASTAAALLVSACAVGPNFNSPAPPGVRDYTPEPPAATASAPGVAGGQAQAFAYGSDIAGDWWTVFHSPEITALVQQALSANHDLKAAQAALAAAHEITLAQRGSFYPQVTASYSATRQRTSGALAPIPADNSTQFNLFTPQVSVAYALDVFGLNRRTAESARAQEQSVHFQLVAAHLTLTSNVALAAIQNAALQAEIDATRQLIEIETKSVEILKFQAARGYASGIDVAAQESQLAQVAATLPPLLKQAAQQHDLLASLTGRFPSEAAIARIDLASLQLPADLPVSLPSKLVEQRPDVRQAEANLHVASAQVGVAEANRFPNILLTVVAGSTSTAFGQGFTPGTNFWTVGGALTAPIFQGGTLLHQQRAAEANYRQATEQYRSTVLGAFQNVADSLTAIQQDAEGLRTAAAAADAAKVTLDLTRRRLQDGYASGLALLNAQQAYQQARVALVQAQAARFSDTVALYQSLGGGWWRRADLAKDTDAN